MGKILIKDNETHFIDSIYDLHQVVDDDTYDMILELLEDKKEEQCNSCNYCDHFELEEQVDGLSESLEDAVDLLKRIIKLEVLDDKMIDLANKVIKKAEWNLV